MLEGVGERELAREIMVVSMRKRTTVDVYMYMGVHVQRVSLNRRFVFFVLKPYNYGMFSLFAKLTE